MTQTLASGTPVRTFGPTGARRGVVVLTDIGGLRSLFDDLGERLATEHGLRVAVVELWPGNEDLDKDQKWAMVPSVDEADRIRDLELAADLLATEQTGLIGFCMGGMYAFRAAAMSSRFHRIVSFYGMIRLPEGKAGPKQSEPIDRLKEPGITPTLAIMGGRDPWCPAEHIAELESIGTVGLREYPEAGHAFAHDPSHENHRPEDAQDAWRNAIDFLYISQK